MAAITDLSDLINRATGGSDGNPETVWFHQVARIAGAAPPNQIVGRFVSPWRYDGYGVGPGALPTGTLVNPTNATTGGLRFTSPSGGRQKHLLQLCMTPSAAGTLTVYDRLAHIGGFSGTDTASQTVDATITRNTGGAGNFIFIEIGALLGTTATTIAATYTNQDGTTSRVTPTVQLGGTGFREATRAVMLPLQAGDTGVRSVQSIQLAASTGTVGDFAVVIGRPVAFASTSSAGVAGTADFVAGLPGIPAIDDAACLSFLWTPITTVPVEMTGAFAFVEA